MRVGYVMDEVPQVWPRAAFWSTGGISPIELMAAVGILVGYSVHWILSFLLFVVDYQCETWSCYFLQIAHRHDLAVDLVLDEKIKSQREGEIALEEKA